MLRRLLCLLLRPLVEEEAPIGGQAVMEGVMMRNGPIYALAVRHPDGTIVAESRPWFILCRAAWLKKPFIRGFPTLLETLVNGIKALNRSAEQAAEAESEKMEGWHLALTLCLALCMAIGLFVITPHLMSLGMQWLGLGGGVEGLSFHLWDGLFKLLIFIGYILAISLVPDIRRVFQYHGAEHKVICAFEGGGEVTATEAARMSRLHPRCGTTFLLFVISISILLHAVLVPALLLIWLPENVIAKHVLTIVFKLLLMVPISALAYELIRCAARKGNTLWGKILRAPGLVLQLLTTYEPDHSQLDVAVVALYEALGDAAPETVRPPSYRSMA
ncbi:MAG: DUF1385 domain-containing protein [Desulfovibrionaceae bacterium]